MNAHDSTVLIFLLVGLCVAQGATITWLIRVKIPALLERQANTARALKAITDAQAVRDRVTERWPDIEDLRERTRRMADGGA